MAERVVARAPGRVNLLGEHTDYNDGLALPFAIAQGVTVTARRLTAQRPRGAEVAAVALDLGEADRFALADPPPAAGWRAFVRGTVAELRAGGWEVPPCELELTGDVPRGAGLSSSAALSVALALALVALSGAPSPDSLALARLCSRVENVWVGARTGLLDQVASLLGRPDHALRIDFRTLAVTPVALELSGWRLVTVDSHSPRAHAESGYNARRRECEAARGGLGLASLRDATETDARSLPDPLGRRVAHVLRENARVEQAVRALARRELAALGPLLDASHADLRDLYDSSTPRVEETVARLRRAGAAGARMMGGGFGGHVLALLPAQTPLPEGALVVAPEAGALVVAPPSAPVASPLLRNRPRP